MKVYMDVCCFNRPFDDQTQDRIRLEAEAIMTILFNCQNGIWQLISSDIVDSELNKMQNSPKKQMTKILADIAESKIKFNEKVEYKAAKYQQLGIDLFDSLHIACAEEGSVDIMLSTDDILVRKAKNISEIKIRIENPVNWFMEVSLDEHNDQGS